jgi:hypothetical protein
MKIYTLLIALVISFFSFQSKASQYVGGEISYNHLGGNTYEIVYHFYRDCSGVPSPTTVQIDFECSSNPAYNFNATLHRDPTSTQQIIHVCSSLATSCNGGTAWGVEEHIYKVQVTIPPCDTWSLSRSACCRNPLTTTTGSSAYYNVSTLNNLNGGNSSQTYNALPKLIACNNKPFSYHPEAIDPDGDSLSFSLFVAYTTSINSSVSYIWPYAYYMFLNASAPYIQLNSATGELQFTPIQNLSTVWGLKIEQWRMHNGNWVLVGETYRDLQLKVDYCNSSFDPVLSGMDTTLSGSYNSNDTLFSMTAYVGLPFEFHINGYDGDTFNVNHLGSPENFNISWNQGISGASFQVFDNQTDSAYAAFLWTPSISDTGTTQCFEVEIQDEGCPLSGYNKYTYCLTVDTVNTTAIRVEGLELGVSIFPVPCQDYILIQQESYRLKEIQLFSFDGRLIKEIQLLNSSQKINVSELKAGVYLLKSKDYPAFSKRIIKS